MFDKPTIEDETTISGQRIVGTLDARRIAQQRATTQLETDIACLKKYEIACQSGSVSTEQFDTIMGKATLSSAIDGLKLIIITLHSTLLSYLNIKTIIHRLII